MFYRYAAFVILAVGIIAFLACTIPPFYDYAMGIDRVAVIPIHTELSVDSSPLSGITSVDTIISQIQSAENDPHINAIVLDINSGGGGVVASYELAKTVQDSKKPIVAMIREIGASGAYWTAISSDYVVANPLSIVGSVGVTASYLSFNGLMQKYGITEVQAVSGSNKEFGSPYLNITPEQKSILDSMVNETFQVFLGDFEKLRHVSNSTLAQVITGRVFLGEDAYKLGLVDALGGRDQVTSYLKSKLGASQINYVEYESSFSIMDLLSGVQSSFNPASAMSNAAMLSSYQNILLKASSK